MTFDNLDAMRARISRMLATAQIVSGSRYQTNFQALGQDFVTNFTALGVKAPEQLEDDFLTLFVWVWSFKDYIKAAYETRGLRGQIVEEEVNASTALMYVADIANRAKHGTLSKSRSGQYAELVDVGFTIPQAALRKIICAGSEVTLDIESTEEAGIQAFVVTRDGMCFDALAVLEEAMHCWETKVLLQIVE